MKDFPQNSHFHPEFIATPVDKAISKMGMDIFIVIRIMPIPIIFFRNLKISIPYIRQEELRK